MIEKFRQAIPQRQQKGAWRILNHSS